MKVFFGFEWFSFISALNKKLNSIKVQSNVFHFMNYVNETFQCQGAGRIECFRKIFFTVKLMIEGVKIEFFNKISPIFGIFFFLKINEKFQSIL